MSSASSFGVGWRRTFRKGISSRRLRAFSNSRLRLKIDQRTENKVERKKNLITSILFPPIISKKLSSIETVPSSNPKIFSKIFTTTAS
jgi:hypothetical protein